MGEMIAFLMALVFKLFILGVIIVVIALLVNNRNNNSNRRGTSYRSLTRSQNDRYISGVCGGIAEYFGLNATLIRLIFLLIVPAGLLIYIVLAVILPVSRV